jgi:MoaA/NifB/PqqE/SkfB family radical SAM enzyme
MALNHLATRFTCTWPWSTLVLLCDGRVVCGCADPYARRVLGDARQASIHEIWTGVTIERLRRDLNSGGSTFCGDCPLKRPLGPGEAPPEHSLDVPPEPSRLYIECTAACNISCFEACCAPETGITRTRQAGMLDIDLAERIVEETGPSLVRIDLFNYGETFLHKRAVELAEFIKSRYPHIYLYTSTNGLAFRPGDVERLVQSGIDEVTFSIDGATPESYARYRRRGNFDVAITNMRAMVAARREAGRDVPVINWRYILFTWNDSASEMDRARELAADIGVDRLTCEITAHPESVF